MERRATWLVVFSVLMLAGCDSSSTPTTAPSGAAATTSTSPAPNPAEGAAAADIAHRFLDAVVRGDTQGANNLLTPLAVERIAASGKPFQLPGLANYTFRVGQVRIPSEDKAFVQCMGTDRTAEGQAVEEEFCWLMSKTGTDWRIAGISYTAGPQKTLMIYSFEDPEKGAIPVQQLMARASGQTAAAQGAQSTQPQMTRPQPSPQSAPTYPAQSQPYTAQEPSASQNHR
jgi:hypothetical protein